jgi:hypothetical protein
MRVITKVPFGAGTRTETVLEAPNQAVKERWITALRHPQSDFTPKAPIPDVASATVTSIAATTDGNSTGYDGKLLAEGCEALLKLYGVRDVVS